MSLHWCRCVSTQLILVLLDHKVAPQKKDILNELTVLFHLFSKFLQQQEPHELFLTASGQLNDTAIP